MVAIQQWLLSNVLITKPKHELCPCPCVNSEYFISAEHSSYLMHVLFVRRALRFGNKRFITIAASKSARWLVPFLVSPQASLVLEQLITKL